MQATCPVQPHKRNGASRPVPVPKDEQPIQAGDLLRIHASPHLPAYPIDSVYQVDGRGRVALGPVYGHVEVRGRTFAQAESKIRDHLMQSVHDTMVAVTRGGWQLSGEQTPRAQLLLAGKSFTKLAPIPQAPYRIAAGDLLEISATMLLPERPVRGLYLVESDGTVHLGLLYGRIPVAGKTLTEAEAAIDQHLRLFVADPKIAVTLGGWREALAPVGATSHRQEN